MKSLAITFTRAKKISHTVKNIKNHPILELDNFLSSTINIMVISFLRESQEITYIAYVDCIVI